MNGVIGLSQNGSVFCNILDCHHEAQFNWFFQNTEKQPLVSIKGGNIIDFVGDGRYICKVICGEAEGIFDANLAMSFAGREVPPKRQEDVIINQKSTDEWDFTKLPKDKKLKEAIVAHTTNKEWKKLAIIHNNYQLSNKTICCNMSEVEEKFTEYVKNLPARKGKMVRGTK